MGLTHPRLPLPKLLILDNLDMSSQLAMLDIHMVHILMLLDTPMALLPMLTVLLSLLMSPLSMLPRLPMLLLVESSTLLVFTVLLMLDLLPTPTVLLSPLNLLMLLLPVLLIWPPLLLYKNHLVY